MQLTSCLGIWLLLFCWGTKGVEGSIDWEAIPEGLLVGPGVGNVQVTDFCDVVRDEKMELNEALRGRNLSIVVQYGAGFDFFRYDPDEELSFSNPGGMVPSMLDDLARRAGFSWRNSFVAYNTNTTNVLHGRGVGKWDRMLNWTTSNFDLSVDKWFLTTARLESEIVFLHSWFDASLILVDQGDRKELNWFGFAAPFDNNVWAAIGATVVFSALFMMYIDDLERARDNRSWKTWIGDHLYKSTLAFSQQFIYNKPRSGAGRIFLSTFSFWAMLIGATYTANLASLLVENALASSIDSIKAAMDAKVAICVHDGSASHTIVNTMYPAIKTYDNIVRTGTPTEMYDNLASGACDILVGTRQEFEILKVQEKYGCNLVQAGPELHSGSASFAIKFDPLSCDSVLAYVLNIHLHAMSIDGNTTKYWDGYINGIDGTCANKEELQQRRLLEMEELGSFPEEDMVRRRLNTGDGGGAGTSSLAAAADGDSQVLSISGMAGVFMVHAFGTLVALVMVAYTHFRRRFIKAPKLRRMEQQAQMESSTKINSGRTKMDAELYRKYQDLKNDFMLQLDNIFEEHMETKQKSQYHETPYYENETHTTPYYEGETASEESLVTPSSMSLSTPPGSGSTSRFGMDGVIHTAGSGKEAKAEAKEYHRSSRALTDINENSTDGVVHTIGLAGRIAKKEAKAYHKSSRNNSANIDSSTGGDVIQTMGSGKAAKMEAKAYHRKSLLSRPSLGGEAVEEAKAYQRESIRLQLDVSESFDELSESYRKPSDISESFRSVRR